MNDADRWTLVKEIFDAALERPQPERLAYLRDRCGGDEALKAEVESLLAAYDSSGSFLARPAIHCAPESTVEALDLMWTEAGRVLRVGDRLGPYEVTGFVGAGAMGEVYRARDIGLGRDVAVKVLPDLFLDDEERRARFEREARLLATLNHPNIATVHGFAELADDARQLRGLVMELVEGETLAERLAPPAHGRRGLPIREALDIARQVAGALEAAHEKGIIHRDLKPGNIKLTPKGVVKVLDFGLAKATRTQPHAAPTTLNMPTGGATDAGVLLGTVPYMSPEQARGKPVDARTDVWAFGCLVYELLTGDAAFSGETASDTLARILEREPDWRALPAETPEGVHELLRGCLAKKLDARVPTITEARNRIEATLALEVGLRSPRQRHARAWRTTGIALAIALVAGAFAVAWFFSPAAVPRLSNPLQVTAVIGLENFPSWAPDGRTLAYESAQTGNWDIWVSQPGGDTAVNRTAEFAGDDRYPAWSPDGRQIAFWSSREGGGYFVMPSVGGLASRIAATPGTNAPYHGAAAWSADGTQLACVQYRPVGATFESSLEIVSMLTRETRRFALPGLEEARLDLAWSRDGRLMAYVDAAQPTAETTQLRLLRLSDGSVVDVTDARTKVRSPQWAPDGRALYFVSNRVGSADLWWQPLRVDGSPQGPAHQVTSGLEVLQVNLLSSGLKLAYSKGRWVSNIWRVPVRFDRPATWSDAEQITFEQAFVEAVDVARDGKRILFSSDRSGNQDVWTMSLDSGEVSRLTSDPAPEWAPALSPDGTRVAFYSSRTGDREIWVMPAEGGPARQLTASKGLDAGAGWSPDGKEIAFRSERLGSSDIWVMKADGSDPVVLAADPAADYSPDFSPDGRWLAFSSNRGGVPRIWRVPRLGGEPEPLATGLGPPTWTRDGTHVLFRANEPVQNVWAVSVESRQARPLTSLIGRRGILGMGLATDGRYLYFAWRDDVGDIWVADIKRGD